MSNSSIPRYERIAITGTCNADGIEAGDTITVRRANDFTDGDLVVWETPSGEVRARYLYRAKGKGTYSHFSYPTESRNYGVRREMYLSGHVHRIIGIAKPPNAEAIERNYQRLERKIQGKQDSEESAPKRPARQHSPTFIEARAETAVDVEELRVCLGSDKCGKDRAFREPLTTDLLALASITNSTILRQGQSTAPYLQLVWRPYVVEWLIMETVPYALIGKHPQSAAIVQIWKRIVKTIQTAFEKWNLDNPAAEKTGRRRKEPIPTESEKTEKIAELRERISNLDDDITSGTKRFELEREIYDLEHPPEDNDSILDAEYITGRGFTNRAE